MSDRWEETKLQQYIDDEIEESLTLDYKGAGSLSKQDSKKKSEITKDVSAMANSAGGIIIYGVAEYQTAGRRHLPEKIDPIDRSDFSKEWLDQIISNIRPKIDGIVIHPVPLSSGTNHVAYVVEIPKSNTAHQATDKRYYKRFNFESVMMDDYEIRDVMGRGQYPKIALELWIEIKDEEVRETALTTFGSSRSSPQFQTAYTLWFRAKNVGQVYAQFVNAIFGIPYILLPKDPYREIETVVEDGIEYFELGEDNTVRDVVDVKIFGTMSSPQYGPSRFDPILPGLSRSWDVELTTDFPELDFSDIAVKWTVYADNSPPTQGSLSVARIEIIDKRKRP